MLEPSSERCSVGLRLAAAVELRHAPGASIELLEDMRSKIDSTARDLTRDVDDSGRQRQLIAALVVDLHHLTTEPGGAELDSMVQAFSNRVLPRVGNESNDLPCTCGGSSAAAEVCCLCDLVKISEFVVSKVRDLYSYHLGETYINLPRPRYRAKCVPNDATHAYFGHEGSLRFDVNAYTKVKDRDIIVSLELRPKALDMSAAAQTLYLLIHETVCHAYQSLEASQRRNSDDTCAWSDGWMDALAWVLTSRWIHRERSKLPTWLSDLPHASELACKSFHDRRYTSPACIPMTQVDLIERQQARLSFHTLWELWDTARPSGVDIEEHRATKFSVLLNHASVDDNVRRHLILQLNTALIRRQGRSIEVSGICSEFLDLRNPDRLLEDLAALNELPSKSRMP